MIKVALKITVTITTFSIHGHHNVIRAPHGHRKVNRITEDIKFHPYFDSYPTSSGFLNSKGLRFIRAPYI